VKRLSTAVCAAVIHSFALKATFMSASRSLRLNEVPLRQGPLLFEFQRHGMPRAEFCA
jgi:hypothetical protein